MSEWFYIRPPNQSVHVARSNLSGTFTACDIELVRGWDATRQPPALRGQMCTICYEASRQRPVQL